MKDVFNISDVEYAILETSGELSVMLKNTKDILPRRSELDTVLREYPTPLVLDGEVLDETSNTLVSADAGWRTN